MDPTYSLAAKANATSHTQTTGQKIQHILTEIFWNLTVFTWDNTCVLLNMIFPKYEPNEVVPKGCPGYRGVWPAYHPPGPGDSRSACPMLNAMANHGILPHDGKNITFRDLNTKVRQTFNFAPSFCFFVPKFSANFLDRSYFSDTFSLEDLSLHSDKAIEHDASLTRQDKALVPDQGYPDQGLVDDLLNVATGKCEDGSPKMTIPDLSKALSKRRADARKTNAAYTENFFHRMFGSANSATMLTIFGGRIEDLKPMLKEERFSEKWQPRVLDRFGLTMAKFNFTVLPVERGIDVKKFA